MSCVRSWVTNSRTFWAAETAFQLERVLPKPLNEIGNYFGAGAAGRAPQMCRCNCATRGSRATLGTLERPRSEDALSFVTGMHFAVID